MNPLIEEQEEPAGERERLEHGVRQIVTSRERTPRDPRWHRAWWRTLLRYNRRLADLHQQERETDTQAGPSHDDAMPDE